MSNDRRENSNRLSFKQLFLHCFRSRSRPEDFTSTSGSDSSDEYLAESVSTGTCQRRKNVIVSKPRVYTFKEALFYEGLLVPRGPTNPEGNTVLRIGYGLSDREISPRGIIHTSFCRSRWDSVLDLPRYRQMVENYYPEDPLVDGLPATLWIDCLEPSLAALVALNRMKKRKSNLSLGRHLHVVESSSDTTIANGDNDEVPDDDVIVVGPHGPPPVNNQDPPVILPTDEVRPSIWIFHDLPMEDIPESLIPFVQFSRKESFRRRSRITVRTSHQSDSSMPGAAAFPNLTVDDMPDNESESSSDSSTSDDDTSESNDSGHEADDPLLMEGGSIYGLLYE